MGLGVQIFVTDCTRTLLAQRWRHWRQRLGVCIISLRNDSEVTNWDRDGNKHQFARKDNWIIYQYMSDPRIYETRRIMSNSTGEPS